MLKEIDTLTVLFTNHSKNQLILDFSNKSLKKIPMIAKMDANFTEDTKTSPMYINFHLRSTFRLTLDVLSAYCHLLLFTNNFICKLSETRNLCTIYTLIKIDLTKDKRHCAYLVSNYVCHWKPLIAILRQKGEVTNKI